MNITRLANRVDDKLQNYHINCNFKVDILIKKGFLLLLAISSTPPSLCVCLFGAPVYLVGNFFVSVK